MARARVEANCGKQILLPTESVASGWRRYYRAPELVMDRDMYGPAVDMWAYACILIELAISKPPFLGANNTMMVRSISGIDWPNAARRSRMFHKGDTQRTVSESGRGLAAHCVLLASVLLSRHRWRVPRPGIGIPTVGHSEGGIGHSAVLLDAAE